MFESKEINAFNKALDEFLLFSEKNDLSKEKSTIFRILDHLLLRTSGETDIDEKKRLEVAAKCMIFVPKILLE